MSDQREPKALSPAEVDFARQARFLLPDPGPEVVGDLIATLDALLREWKPAPRPSVEDVRSVLKEVFNARVGLTSLDAGTGEAMARAVLALFNQEGADDAN